MAVVGWILLALFGLIVLAFFIPVRICVEYVQEWRIAVRLFGVVPVWSFLSAGKPKDKPEKAPEKPTEASKEKTEPEQKKPSVADELKALFREDGVSGVMSFFGKLIGLLTTTLCSLVRFITIRKLALCIRIGNEEADVTALTYGRISAAVSASLTVLSELVRLKKPTVRIIPDFAAEHMEARMRMIVWVWPFGLVGAGIAALFRFLAIWSTLKKAPQDGAGHTANQPKSK